MNSLASWILASLRAQGTGHAFLVPGYLLGPTLQVLAEAPDCRAIVCAHELGAAFAADGYARVSGTPGWCLAISAPGASNLLTGAIAARLDHQRVLYLVGDVPRNSAGRSAFQDGSEPGSRDLDLFRVAVPMARRATTVGEAEDALRAALQGPQGGPPGPAFLSLPRDLQAELCAAAPLPRLVPQQPAALDSAGLERLAQRLASGERLALWVGEATTGADFARDLLAFAERYAVPVATTMPAKGIFPEHHPLSLGCLGYGGTPRARAACTDPRTDSLLALGVDLNERNTLQWDQGLLVPGRICRVLPWPGAQAHPGVADYTACTSAVLHALAHADAPLRRGIETRRLWLDELRAQPLQADLPESPTALGLHPATLVATLRQTLPRGSKLFVDAGLCRRAVGQWWTCQEPGELFTSPVTAPMGWGLAASIGGQLAAPEARVVALAGDGSMLMHGLEIVTAVRYQVPVIWVINNNAALGTVWQRAPTPEAALLTLPPRLDWAAQAELCGAKGYRARTSEELASALLAALRTRQPAVIDVQGTLDFAPDDPLFGGTTHGQKAPG
ncbi:MAG: thiamine pyrophosphate-binding protein [Betaproteobacteria bacterium]|nr:thiamine pyrophosphate-binding protein [Betaproteobacteria bacterium]